MPCETTVIIFAKSGRALLEKRKIDNIPVYTADFHPAAGVYALILPWQHPASKLSKHEGTFSSTTSSNHVIDYTTEKGAANLGCLHTFTFLRGSAREHLGSWWLFILEWELHCHWKTHGAW